MPIKNIILGQRITREMRHEMTPAEKVLWKELRGNKLRVHFRRQQSIAGFIVDFYCHKASLVIELDGDITKDNKIMTPNAIRQWIRREYEFSDSKTLMF